VNPDLWALGLAAGVGLTSAFVAYWFGVAATERRLGPLIHRLYAQRQAHMQTSMDLAQVIYELRRSGHEMPLSRSERMTFDQITANWEN